MQQKKNWYRGKLSHDNNSRVYFYVNGTSDHSTNVSQSSNADFTVNSSDTSKLIVNNAGLYLVTFIDGVKSAHLSHLKFILDKPFMTTSGDINIQLQNTKGSWVTIANTVMLYFQANTSLKIQADNSNTLFDGTNNSYIMLAKQD